MKCINMVTIAAPRLFIIYYIYVLPLKLAKDLVSLMITLIVLLNNFLVIASLIKSLN